MNPNELDQGNVFIFGVDLFRIQRGVTLIGAFEISKITVCYFADRSIKSFRIVTQF